MGIGGLGREGIRGGGGGLGGKGVRKGRGGVEKGRV